MSVCPSLLSFFIPSELPRIVSFIVTDNEGASSEAVVARVNFIVRDNKPTIDLNGPELPGRNVSVDFYEGGPAVMVSVITVWCLCVKCVTVVIVG